MAELSVKSLIDLLAPTFHSNNDANNPLTTHTEPNVNLLSESPYFDVQKTITSMKSNPNSFTIFSLNCQSVNAKLNELNIFLEQLLYADCSFSVICLQESWLKNDDDTSLLQLDGYKLINQPLRISPHGGLLIYLKDNFNYSVLPSIVSSHCESLTIEISRRNKKSIIISNVYRLPVHTNIVHDEFLIHFNQLLKATGLNNVHGIVTGDFNIDLLRINDSDKPYINTFLDSAMSAGFLPKITHPTRYSPQHDTWTLIDNFFVKSSLQTKLIISGILTRKISDHLGYLLCLNEHKVLKPKPPPPKFVYINCNSADSMLKFKNSLVNANIMNILNPSDDINTNYNNFSEILCKNKQVHIPHKKVKFKKYKHSNSNWITPAIIKSIEFRDGLYKKYINSPPNTFIHQGHKINLDTYNKILKSTIRAAKKIQIEESFIKCKNNMKKTWGSINQVLNRNFSNSALPEKFSINKNPTSDKKIIANAFNDFFVGIGENLATSMGDPQSGVNFEHFLKNKPSSTFKISAITADTVLKNIESLKKKNSYGHDFISTKLLQSVKHELCDPIAFLVNQSFLQNKFPDLLKLAKVIPVFKKDNPQLIDNYRPISLLPAISKIFESIVYDQLFEHFTSNKLFYQNQYGFRAGHSTEHASIELVDRVLQYLQDDDIPISIFMDLSKAFDTLNHDILLKKLDFYGIDTGSLNFFSSYLKNRKQYVVIDNTDSDHSIITTGVPQGSILGPLLFLIYINDIASTNSAFSILSYADDTTLTSSINSLGPRNISTKINSELAKINDWLIANRLSLNVAKTKYIIFHQPNKKVPVINILINNISIEQVDSFTFLGLTIDKEVNWKNHINKTCLKILKIVGIMSRLKHFLPNYVLKTIYNSLILPQIHYSLICWGYGNTTRILNLQKRAVRTISFSSYNSHTAPLFKHLRLLTIDHSFLRFQLKFYYQLKHQLLPSYLNDIKIITSQDTHRYNTRYKSDPQSIRSKQYTKKRIRISIAQLIKETSTSNQNNPKYFNDDFSSSCNNNNSISKNTLTSIINKVNLLSLHGFCNFIKVCLNESYDDTPCSKSPCHPCGRQ